MQTPTDGARRDLKLSRDLDQRQAALVHIARDPDLITGQPETTQLNSATNEMPDDRLTVSTRPRRQLADRRPSLVTSHQLGSYGGADRGLALLKCRYVLASKVGDPPPGPLLTPPQRPLLVPPDQGFHGRGEVWRLSRLVH
jgi:hypothetical protein